MSTLPTVAIIGAGSSGITAAKALHERGVPFDCFEASDRVGGNWVFENKNGMSAAYRDLHINTSRDRMQFSDFPMPRSLPDFPHHTQIAAYFDDYVDHFGFRDRIRFETPIARAQPARRRHLAADRRRTARRATTTCSSSPTATTGTSAGPSPRSPAPTTFEGIQMHAHDYRDNAFLAGKDVVVLGMGNSAMDIAVEASYVADTTHLAARRGAWIVPKYLFGKPLDQISTIPHVPHWLNARVSRGDHPPAHRPARALRPAAARPPLRRGAPDRRRADPRPHHPRRDRAAAEHRAARARLGAVRRRHAGARRRRHLLHGLPHHVSVLRRGLPRRAGQPHRPLSPRLPAGRPEPRVRRPAAAARRDHAARRGAGRSGSPSTCAASTTCRRRARWRPTSGARTGACAGATSRRSATRSRSTSTRTSSTCAASAAAAPRAPPRPGDALPVPARAAAARGEAAPA